MENKTVKIVFGLISLIVIYWQFAKNILGELFWFNFVFVNLVITLVPGFFLLALFYPKEKINLLEVWPLSFVFSLLLFTPLGLFAYLRGLTLNQLTGGYLLLSILFGLVNLAVSSKGSFQSPVSPKEKKKVKINNQKKWENKKQILVLVFLLVIVVLLSAHFGGFTSGDYIHHMTAIRKLVELPKIIFGHYILKDLPRPIYGHNIWYLFFSMGSKITHLDPVEFWVLSPVFLTSLMVLAFWLVSRVVFDSANYATVATSIFVFFDGIMSYSTLDGKFTSFFWVWSTSQYPASIARDIILLVILFFVFKFIYQGNKRYLFILPLLGVVIALTHFYYFYMLLFVLGCFFLFSLFIPNKIENLPKKILLAIIFIAVPAFFYVTYYTAKINLPLVNKCYLTPEAMAIEFKPVVKLGGTYPLIDPFKALWTNFPRTLAYLLLPFLFCFFRKEPGALYCFSIAAVVLFIFVNPLLLYFLWPLNPGMDRFYRAVEIVPYYWIIALFISKGLYSSNRKIQQVTLISSLVVLGVLLLPQKTRLEKINYTTENSLQVLKSNVDFLKFVKEKIPPGSVVLMDSQKIWFWTIFFPHYPVIAAWDMHLPPNYDQTLRVKEQEEFLKNSLTEDSFTFLNKYNVDYVLLDQGYAMNKDFSKYMDRFKEVVKTHSLTIYRYNKKE